MLFNLLYNLFTQLPFKNVCYKPWEFDSKNNIPKPGAKPYIPINRCDSGDKSVYINIP